MPKILVVELSDSDAKLLQASTVKNEIVIEHAQRVSFEGLEKTDEDYVERRARVAAVAKKIKNIAQDILIVIPKQSVTLRQSLLPTSDPVEIANMVVFEAEKIIPFNVERHTISYSITEGPSMEGTEVMIAAVDEPIINQWLNIVKDIKAEPRQVDVSCLSISHTALVTLPVEQTPEAFAIFQISHNNTDVTIIINGKIVATRSIPRMGTQQLLESIPGDSSYDAWLQKNINAVYVSIEDAQQPIDLWFKKLFTQFQRTIEFAQRDYKIPLIKNIFIAGEAAALPGFSEVMGDKIGFQTPAFNPLEKVKREKGAVIDDACLPAFSTAYGAANRHLIYPEIDRINVLPAEVIEGQEAAQKKLQLTITGLIATVGIVMAFIFFNSEYQLRKTEVENLTGYLKELDVIVEQLDDREERIDIIRQIRSEQAGALDILARISDYTEVGSHTLRDGKLTLSNFEFELADEVRIDGYAMETEDITQFVRYLTALENRGKKIFEDVDIRSQDPTRLPRRDNQIYQFRIVAPLNQSG